MAGVLDQDFQVPARLEPLRSAGVVFADFDAPKSHFQDSAVGHHRVPGIGRQIHQHLMNLGRITEDDVVVL